MLTTLLDDLPAATPVGLYGSALGARLYASKFGFVDRGTAQLLQISLDGRAVASSAFVGPIPGAPSLVPAGEHMRGIAELDEEVYCARRERDLARWADTVPGAAWALTDDSGRCEGFVLGRRAEDGAVWLGPLISRTSSGAEALLRAALSGLPAGTAAVQIKE